jgi:PAS domain-containing protein
MASQSVELILARNLVSSIDLAALLVDPDGVIVYFNDPAGELVGRRFEEVGPLSREEWSSRFGPFDEFGQVIPTDDLPATVALRTGLPVNARAHMRIDGGDLIHVELSALPLSSADGFKGALVVFWRADDD